MRCTKCNKDKPDSEFRRNKNFTQRRGLSYWCKSCDTVGKRSEHGRLVIMYNSTRSASTTRKADVPSYSFSELKTWAYKHGYQKCYNKWKKSDYAKSNVPSIDRTDPNKPYTLDNIKIVTWSVNDARNITEMSTPVTRYDLNHKNPKRFTSIRSAARSISDTNTGGAIIRAMNTGKSVYSYYWVSDKTNKEQK